MRHKKLIYIDRKMAARGGPPWVVKISAPNSEAATYTRCWAFTVTGEVKGCGSQDPSRWSSPTGPAYWLETEGNVDLYGSSEPVIASTSKEQQRCTYCGAANNGTCAYPSEGKPGCLLSAHRQRMRELLASKPPVLRFNYIKTSVGGSDGVTVTMGFNSLDMAQDVHKWLSSLQGSAVETTEVIPAGFSTVIQCDGCGVHYVQGARHWSQCPTHPGEWVQVTPEEPSGK